MRTRFFWGRICLLAHFAMPKSLHGGGTGLQKFFWCMNGAAQAPKMVFSPLHGGAQASKKLFYPWRRGVQALQVSWQYLLIRFCGEIRTSGHTSLGIPEAQPLLQQQPPTPIYLKRKGKALQPPPTLHLKVYRSEMSTATAR